MKRMIDRNYFKLNASLATASNAATPIRDANGNKEATIELRLPANMYQQKNPDKYMQMQTSKLHLSLFNLPIASIPADLENLEITGNSLRTKAWIACWPFYVSDSGVQPLSDMNIPFSTLKRIPLEVPFMYENFDILEIRRTGRILITRFDTIEKMLSDAFKRAYHESRPGSQSIGFDPHFNLTTNECVLTFSTTGQNQDCPVLWGAPGALIQGQNTNMVYRKSYVSTYDKDTGTAIPKIDSLYAAWGFYIAGNSVLQQFTKFLPWFHIRYSALYTGQKFPDLDAIEDDKLYLLNSNSAHFNCAQDPIPLMIRQSTSSSFDTRSGYNLSYTWDNLTTLLMSPVSSVVILMDGVGVSNQLFPINIQQPQGSSLTTTIPIIENYIPLSRTLADLNDELVITKDAFDNTPTITIPPTALGERVLRFRACFILKDGTMYPVYIPEHGVFAIQLTFKF